MQQQVAQCSMYKHPSLLQLAAFEGGLPACLPDLVLVLWL
jgi:hypothetical protein